MAGQATISTVTVPATIYDLVDLETVKDDISITDSSSDEVLRRYITSVSTAIQQYCNRKFPVESVLDEFWPRKDAWPAEIPGGIQPLQLSKWPIVAVTTVIENGVTLVAGSDSTGDFRIDATNGQLVRLDTNGYPKQWPAFPISVQYDAGFSPIPFDVQDAAIRMIKARWFARDRDPFLKTRTLDGIGSRTWWFGTGVEAGAFPPDIKDLIDNYRVAVVVS